MVLESEQVVVVDHRSVSLRQTVVAVGPAKSIVEWSLLLRSSVESVAEKGSESVFDE